MQQPRSLAGSHCLLVERSWEEDAVPVGHRRQGPDAREAYGACENRHNMKPAVAANVPLSLWRHLVQKEELAGHQAGNDCVTWPVATDGNDRFEVRDGLDTSFDMKRPSLPVGPRSIPVEESVRHVARLLDLRDQQTCADGMHRASWNEYAVAGTRLERMKDGLARTRPDGCGEIVRTDAFTEPRIDPTSRDRVDDIPGFGLPAVRRIEQGRASVVGMNLDRENLVGIQKLEKQREHMGMRMIPEKGRCVLANEGAERSAGKQPLCDDTLISPAVDQLPRLGIVIAWREVAAKSRREASAAPEVAAIDRREHQGRQTSEVGLHRIGLAISHQAYCSKIRPIPKQQAANTSMTSIGPDVIFPPSSSTTAMTGSPSPTN